MSFRVYLHTSPLSLDMIRWLVTDHSVHDRELKNPHVIVRYRY
jgi:hypothetical protein